MPQVAFTVNGLFNELRDKCDFEIVLINNTPGDLAHKEPEHHELNGPMYFEKLIAEGRAPHLVHIDYPDKLSHWNAKRVGLKRARGKFIFFCDAHVLISPGALHGMWEYYKDHWQEMNGSIHLPWSYLNDGPDRRLEYCLVTNTNKGIIHYTSKSYKGGTQPYAVPCMSTCGMMIERSLLDKVGPWPTEFGIYGGGENYFNFVQAVLGMQPWIWPSYPFWHYAAPRGYSWNWYDWHRNRMIATYLVGGAGFAKKWATWLADEIKNGDAMGRQGNPQIAMKIYRSVVHCGTLMTERARIFEDSVMTIEEWVGNWRGMMPPEYVSWV